jgi:hypothetical protein
MENKDIEQFWLNNYKVLYDNNNYTKFIPSKSMTKIQQLNALSRFSIYAFILIILFDDDEKWLYIPIFIFILCIILYKLHQYELLEIKNKNVEQFNNMDEYDLSVVSQEKKTCTKPTKDNPFMNFLISDYLNDPNKKKACVNDKEIQNDINQNFNNDLYQDIDDLFDKKNSQRQFYTMPNTQNPNEQKEFAEWLYKIPETCKTDQETCLKYEDIRFKK